MRKLIASSLTVLLTSCAADSADPMSEPTPDPVDETMPAPDAMPQDDAPPMPAPSPSIQIAVVSPKVRIARNNYLNLAVTVTRANGATGDIELGMDDLPAGVTAGGLTIPDGETTGTLELWAGPGIDLGTYATATIRATSGDLQATLPIEIHLTDKPGAMDLSFGYNGWTLDGFVTGHDEKVRLLATMADGKIVACGSDDTAKVVFVARYLPDGAPDESFGPGGVRKIGDGVITVTPIAVGATPDGVIRVVVVESGVTRVYAFAANGTLDSSYGAAGSFALSKANLGYDFGASLGTVADDGSVVVARYGVAPFDVYRITPKGALDSSFDGDGKASATFGAGVAFPKAVTVRPDGRIVFAGSYQEGFYTTYAIAQLTATGAMDSTFSDDGKWTLDLGKTTSFSSLAVLSDGRVVALDPYGATPQLFMFAESGHLDYGFGKQGVATSGLELARLVLPVDGGFVALGSKLGGGALEKWTLDGVTDAWFGTNGIASVNVGTSTQAAAVDAQGRIVVAAMVYVNGEMNDVALARVWD